MKKVWIFYKLNDECETDTTFMAMFYSKEEASNYLKSFPICTLLTTQRNVAYSVCEYDESTGDLTDIGERLEDKALEIYIKKRKTPKN
jgi:hypothetical protein